MTQLLFWIALLAGLIGGHWFVSRSKTLGICIGLVALLAGAAGPYFVPTPDPLIHWGFSLGLPLVAWLGTMALAKLWEHTTAETEEERHSES